MDDLVDALDEQAIVARAVLRRARARAAGDLDRPRAGAAGAADEQLLVRETIRGVAARHGLVASLAPKPWPDDAGNGATSTSRSGTRRAEPLPRRVARRPPLGRGALVRRRRARAPARAVRPDRAELQLVPPHRPALLGGRVHVLGPRQPRGAGARAVGLRGSEEASTNVELKSADASCNPYLAVGGLIAAGLDGLERGLEPPEPVRGRSGDDRGGRAGARAASGRLPATQKEALDALESDRLLMDALGPVLADVLPRRPPLRVGGLLGGRRGIRAAGPLLEVLNGVAARRPARARDPARASGRRSTSSAASSRRAPIRASGRTSPPG